MFARFRNLFAKNKNDAEEKTDETVENLVQNAESSFNKVDTTEDASKLEGINFLKSLVENEQKQQSHTLSEEVAELLKKRLSKTENCLTSANQSLEIIKVAKDNENVAKPNEVSNENLTQVSDVQSDAKKLMKSSENEVKDKQEELDTKEINFDKDRNNFQNENEIKKELSSQNETINAENSAQSVSPATDNKICDSNKSNEALNSSLYVKESNNSYNKQTDLATLIKAPKTLDTQSSTTAPIKAILNDNLAESLKSLSQSSIKENSSHTPTESCLEKVLVTNFYNNNSSIVVEDVASEITTPSPTVESTLSCTSCSSNTSTLDTNSNSPATTEILDPSKIIVNPIDNNGLACSAITSKLSDIAEVAESLDAVIRNVQENVQSVEIELNASPCHKKLNTLRSASSEDWHSRSTEDDSFATASEGNFTPSSSSFHTASGRTSSYISCDKNSFDASEADDSTYAFDMPELASPFSMSFEGSEQSYLSAQPPNVDVISQDKQKTNRKLSETHNKYQNPLEADQSSTADAEEWHSESVTPTPQENYDDYHVQSIAIESETEVEVEAEVAGIAKATSREILTEYTTLPMSRTPEVSPSTSYNCSNQNPITTQMTVSVATDSNDNNSKPNAAWRRSKYYENLTKQTIKGFL